MVSFTKAQEVLIGLAISGFIQMINTETCTMDLTTDTQGRDSGGDIHTGISTIEGCNAKCIGDGTCVAANVLQFCFLWKDQNDILSGSGQTLYVKNCVSDTTTTTDPPTTADPSPTCSMDQDIDTDASNHQLEVPAPSVESCQQACKALSECRYIVFIQSSSTCHLHTASKVTWVSMAGHTTSQKKQCEDGKSCCFDTLEDLGISESPAVLFDSSQSSCRDICLNVATCTASVFTGTSCKIFTGIPATSSSSGVNLYKKNCPEGASSGLLTYSPTCGSSALTAVSLTVSLLLLIAVYLV